MSSHSRITQVERAVHNSNRSGVVAGKWIAHKPGRVVGTAVRPKAAGRAVACCKVDDVTKGNENPVVAAGE